MDLQALVNAPVSQHVQELAELMFANFNTHWGKGEAGTVLDEHKTEGPNRRPKGVPLLTLLATFVDPRTKRHK